MSDHTMFDDQPRPQPDADKPILTTRRRYRRPALPSSSGFVRGIALFLLGMHVIICWVPLEDAIRALNMETIEGEFGRVTRFHPVLQLIVVIALLGTQLYLGYFIAWSRSQRSVGLAWFLLSVLTLLVLRLSLDGVVGSNSRNRVELPAALISIATIIPIWYAVHQRARFLRPWKPEDYDLICEHCGYDLQLFKSDRCPECGRLIVDDDDPTNR